MIHSMYRRKGKKKMQEITHSVISLAFRQDAKAAIVELLNVRHNGEDTEEHKLIDKAVKEFFKDEITRVEVDSLTVYDSSNYWQQIFTGHQQTVDSLKERIENVLSDVTPDGHELFMKELGIYQEYVDGGINVVQDYGIGIRETA